MLREVLTALRRRAAAATTEAQGPQHHQRAAPRRRSSGSLAEGGANLVLGEPVVGEVVVVPGAARPAGLASSR